MNTSYIPNLTHPSGQVLTAADWAEAGVNIAYCDLKALLIKPGIEVLKQLKNLKQYFAWPGQLILNTNALLSGASAHVQIRSPFDGRRLSFEKKNIEALIQTFQPHLLIPNETLKENNQPSIDALNGVMYLLDNQPEPTIQIQDKTYTHDFSVIDKKCECPACKSQLTRAYFHHLYQHTPLLCHRWLIMHNQWVMHHSAT